MPNKKVYLKQGGSERACKQCEDNKYKVPEARLCITG